jgi:hypothetical protein
LAPSIGKWPCIAASERHVDKDLDVAIPYGAVNVDDHGRAIFMVETKDKLRVALTDRWGRVAIPDPDPCGGDAPGTCDDGDPCTVDGCGDAGCVHRTDPLAFGCDAEP